MKSKFVRQPRLPRGAYDKPLEEVLGQYRKKTMAKPFQIIKKADDHLLGMKIIRISVGGNKKAGYYLVYRGDLQEVKELLGEAFKAATLVTKEPEISPDMGKKHA